MCDLYANGYDVIYMWQTRPDKLSWMGPGHAWPQNKRLNYNKHKQIKYNNTSTTHQIQVQTVNTDTVYLYVQTHLNTLNIGTSTYKHSSCKHTDTVYMYM